MDRAARHRTALCIGASLIACALPARSAAVQVYAADGADATVQGISRRDSVRALKRARGEQAKFERIRFADLPWRWDSPGGECDERVGRFCVWYSDDDGPPWEPPPESEKVKSARDSLVARLAREAALIPGDRWIAGQRVRYALEAGDFDEAERAARECLAAGWWCRALLGYALHAAQRFAEADSAFGEALRDMPEKERDDWLDLRPLLGDKNESTYRKAKGAERDSLVLWMWWLADPLWMLPGNDRRTEHFSRLVTGGLQERTKSTEGISWGDDLRELLLRFGTPIGWERIRPELHHQGRPSVVMHYEPHSRHFLPPLALHRDITKISADEFTLDPRIPRSDYAPPYADAFDELTDHQLAVFRRGPLARLVAAFEMQQDSVSDTAHVDAAIILGDRPGDSLRVEARTVTGRTVRMEMYAAARPSIVSLEALAQDERRAARVRYGIALHGEPVAGLAISDLLLFDVVDPLPAALEDAIPRARTSLEAAGGEQIGVFWETYWPDAQQETVVFEVALYRTEKGLLRRLVEKVGLAKDGNAVALRWEESWGSETRLSRAVNLELPDLDPGSYRLEVAAQIPGKASVSATRDLEIARR